MACRWTYDSNNNINGVTTESGLPSLLFKELESKFGTQKAIEMYEVSQSDMFKSALKSPVSVVKKGNNIKFQLTGEQEATNNTNESVISDVITTLKATNLAEDVFVLSNEEIKNKLQELGSTKEQVQNLGTAGFVHNNKVFLNKDVMSLDTPIHEFGHLFLNKLKESSETVGIFYKGIQLAKSKEALPYQEYVLNTQPNLKKGSTEFYEEVLAQAIGDAGAKFTTEAQKKTFSDWIEQMWEDLKSILGLNDFISNDKKFKNLTFGEFTQAVAKDLLSGTTIEGLLDSQPNASKGVFLALADNPKYSGAKGIDLKGYNVDFIDTTVDVRTLEQVIDQYEGRVMFITSDYTGIGYDKEGQPIQGGVGYMYIKDNVKGKIGFASLGDGTAQSTLTRAFNQYGAGQNVAVFVVAQAPSSTLGNSYGAKYIGRALKTLKQELTSDEYLKVVESIENMLNSGVILKSVKKSEQGKKGSKNKEGVAPIPVRKDLAKLFRSIENYSSTEFKDEFLKDTSFEIRRELVKKMFFRTSKGDNTVVDNFEKYGFSLNDFLSEYGDKTLLTDEIIRDDKAGSIVGGFGITTSSKINEKDRAEETKNKIADTKGRGITHELFNGKIPSNGDLFVLDSAYGVAENFTNFAKPQLLINDKGEYAKEIDKIFRAYSKRVFKDSNKSPKKYDELDAKEKEVYKAFLQKKNPNYVYLRPSTVNSQIAQGIGITIEDDQRKVLVDKARSGIQFSVKPVFEVPDFKENNSIEEVKNANSSEETGATFNLDGSTYEGGGLIVPLQSVNTTQEKLSSELIEDFIFSQKDKIGNNSVKVGIYKFPNSNTVSIDLNIAIPSKYNKVALDFGKFAGQESLFNLDTFENNKTGASGENPLTFTAEEFKIIAEELSEGRSPLKKLGVITPQNSSNYANLTEDGQGNFVFYHVGDKGYETIIPGLGQNSATNRAEATALRRVGGLAMYYPAPNVGERMVTGQAKYLVKIPIDKVYDFNRDVLNFLDKAEKEFRTKYPGQAFDANNQLAFITKIANEEGYEAVVAQWDGRTRVQTTEEFKPQDVQLLNGNVIVKDFSLENQFYSNKDKGWKSVPTTFKKQGFKNIYNKISDSVGNNFSNPLYSLREMANYSFDDKFAPFKSQEAITKSIKESDIAQELKNEYFKALNQVDVPGYSEKEVVEEVEREEPKVELVVNYVTEQNKSKKPLTKQQKVDLNNVMQSTGIYSIEELEKKLVDIFYDENNLFIINESKIRKSGLYSEYEIRNLVDNQDTVKSAIEALQSTPREDDSDVEQVEKENFDKTSDFNSFGKLNIISPQKIKQEIFEKTVGLDREKFDAVLNTLEYPVYLKSVDRDALFTEVSQYAKAENLQEVDGKIVSTTVDNVDIELSFVKTEYSDDLVNIVGHISKILDGGSFNIYEDLKKLETLSSKIGLDLVGITDKFVTKQFLEDTVNFLTDQPNNFSELYKNIFTKNENQKIEYVKKIGDKDLDLVTLNTTLSEEQLYNDYNLIKVGEGLYARMNKTPLEEVYERVSLALDRKDLQEYVRNNVGSLEGFKNSDNAEVILLYKMYFGVENTTGKTSFKQTSSFSGDYKYLTEKFPTDFHTKIIEEKAKDSLAYREFYSNFGVNKKGVYLKNDNLTNIDIYADENLRQYSLLSNQLPDLTIDTLPTQRSERDDLYNNPQNKEAYKGQYSVISNQEVIVKNTSEEFLKIDGDIYEFLEKRGNLSLFSKLGKNNSSYNVVGIEKPDTNTNLEVFAYLETKPEAFIKTKNLLTKEERKDADENFEC